MRFWPAEPLPDFDPAFDEALRSQVLERTGAIMFGNGAHGNFFTTPTILDDLVRKRPEGNDEWTFTFGGESWSPNSPRPIDAAYAGWFTYVDDGTPEFPSRYKLFLTAALRSPLKMRRENERLRSAASRMSRRLIKTCAYFAVDTTYTYQLNGPKPGGIQRSAVMSIIGLRPDWPDNVTLRQKNFHPIRNPSPLGRYLIFGPEEEHAARVVRTRGHRKLERAFAIDFDIERINKMLVGLGWTAIEASS